ncbi:MAG: hypothetical protein HYZ61_02140 [Candidatus Andersenbacteria bacterium]|nr:hypothetical protein [Candidatus Andersenbacteria bacterium]
MHVVSGLFETFQEADQAVAALNAIGYGTSNISVLGQAEALTSEHHHSEAAEDAGKGAGIGGLIGLLAGAAPFVIPGIGPVIGAGTLIAGALSGAGVGAAAGGIIGLFKKWFGAEDEAVKVQTALEHGDILVAVTTGRTGREVVAQTLRDYGAYEVYQHQTARARATA